MKDKLTHKKFNEAVDKINDSLGTNFMGSEHRKDKEFIMPINLFVSKDREGLIQLWNKAKELIARGYMFEKV